jgi:hypothetical protein
VHVDGREGLVKGQDAEDYHEHGAHERARGTVDVQSRDLPEADKNIGDEEDDEGRDHGRHFSTDREKISRKVLRVRSTRKIVSLYADEPIPPQ